MKDKLEKAAAHIAARSKSLPRSAELAALKLHQEVLESLVAGKPPKAAKAKK